jgi:hypothetical protein
MKNGNFKYCDDEYLEGFIDELTEFVNDNHDLSKDMISTLIYLKQSDVFDNKNMDIYIYIEMFLSHNLTETMIEYLSGYTVEEYCKNPILFEDASIALSEIFLYTIYEYVSSFTTLYHPKSNILKLTW